MDKFLKWVIIMGIVNSCWGKEIKIDEKEMKDKIAQYNEQYKSLSDDEIIAELNKLSVSLPKDMNELMKASTIIDQIGRRNLVTTKDILNKIIKRGEESPNKFVKGFTPEFPLMRNAKFALIRMDINKEFNEKKIFTINQKADYLIEKFRKQKEIGFLLEEMAPNIVSRLMRLLEDKDENIKISALGFLEKSNDVSIQNKIIDMMEKEINKPRYGLFFYCQRVLESMGDKKAYNYLKKKLTHSDPIVRKFTAIGLIKFWERGIVPQRDIKNTLVPLLKDKNKDVSEEIRFHLLDKDLIKENELKKNN